MLPSPCRYPRIVVSEWGVGGQLCQCVGAVGLCLRNWTVVHIGPEFVGLLWGLSPSEGAAEVLDDIMSQSPFVMLDRPERDRSVDWIL